MRFLHLSDLHLGKRLNEASLIEDQEYILREILNIIEARDIDFVIIAGDIYDKPVPPAEAVTLFDGFITEIASRGKQVFIISGNHDSGERLEFGSQIMKNSGVYVSGVFAGVPRPVVLSDSYGRINIYLLPFIKPALFKHALPDYDAKTTDEAVRKVIELMDVDQSERNILICHQFVAGSIRCDSEDIIAGGSDSVGTDAFSKFDYTALGHLHSPQKAGGENIRYCGSPLKYSFSEIGHQKSAVIVELKEKSNLCVTLVPLVPLKDLRRIKGSYLDITFYDNYMGTKLDDYVYITLTDEEDIPNAIGKLRSIYPNILRLDYDNARTRSSVCIDAAENVEKKTPFELISEFYLLQNNQPLSSYQESIVKRIIDENNRKDVST